MTDTLEAPAETRKRFEQAAKFSMTISRSILSEALRKLLAVVPTKLSIPVLGCVLVDVRESVESLIEGDTSARADKITMTATNLDATVTLGVGASVTGSGVVALPAKRLADIVANLPAAAQITITVDGTKAKLKAGRTSYDIVGMPPKEFPLHEPMRDAEPVPLVAATFVNALARAVKFTPDESKAKSAVLMAVCVRVEDGKVVLVATTGQYFIRLVAGEVAGVRETPEFLIDRESVGGIVRLFGALPDGSVIRFSADQNRAAIESSDARLELRLIDGQYPMYKPILAHEPTHTVVCEREALTATLRRVALAADDKSRRLEGTLDADELWFRASTQDAGKAEDVVAVLAHDTHGDSARGAFRFGMNASLMLTCLEAFAVDQVEVSFATPERAVHIKPAGTTDLLTLSLAMPLRLVD